MAKSLSQLTSAEFKASLSIAGDPDKIMDLSKDIIGLVSRKLDMKNIPEMENMMYALQKIAAEINITCKAERKRQQL